MAKNTTSPEQQSPLPQKRGTRTDAKSILRWFWQLFRQVKLQSTINALSGIIRVTLDFAFIWATKQVIDLATGAGDAEGLLPQPATLTGAGLLLISIMALQIALGYASRWIAALLGVEAQNRMQRRIFRHLLHSEWHGREKRHSGDVLNRLISDCQTVVNVVTDTIPQALAVLVRLLLAFLFLFQMDRVLAVSVTIILPVFILLSRLYINRMRSITRAVRDTDSRIQSTLQESIQHRLVLKTMERVSTMLQVLSVQQETLRQQVRHRTLFSSSSNLVLNIGFGGAYLFTFLWSANRLAEGSITFGMMTAFIQLCGQIQGPFRDLTRFIPAIIGSMTAAERLMELEESPLEDVGEPIRFSREVGIRVENVCFAYDSHSRQVLKGASYDFPPGSSTAILGETGAGKTTLIRLILALLKPQEGRVVMYETGSPSDGERAAGTDERLAASAPDNEATSHATEVSNRETKISAPDNETTSHAAELSNRKTEITAPDNEATSHATEVNTTVTSLATKVRDCETEVSARTRCNLVYVPQGNSLFSGTIRWNLLLGSPEASEDELKEALHLACADFVFTIPGGLDSLVGEEGAGLSEGQAQRIAIARALLRKGNVLLLDEATSSLDLQTERQLLENLIAHNEQQEIRATLLFITHRPAVVEHCQQVITLTR
ncbi:MAG: ABC transporter ATP-binding protein/permease [Bacteroidaceae bacterium]|nr:ABC transporter ATP-binding protein/permease [Bacteroidaceae bacterium]